MLISLEDLIKKYRANITGVVHVGAHHGQEFNQYMENDICHMVFVEASAKNFEVLKSRLGKRNPIGGSLQLIHAAAGPERKKASLFTEESNQGQSNSLLAPKEHLTAHPDIVFNGTEETEVIPLDEMVQAGPYNMLVMDVQGYEGQVLDGATDLLKRIDYVYTEVNEKELYSGCTLIGDLDAKLSDFTRIETAWMANTGWGDAFYIRTSLLPKRPETFVPRDFMQPMPFRYPDDNEITFEEWFFFNNTQQEWGGRTYLPVFWTSWYLRHKYGKDPVGLQRLQAFLDGLDRSKKYFTIVQFDDGILNDISHLDIKVYAMAGPRIDYALPLLCWPHAYKQDLDQPRKYVANFVGTDNHPIRMAMIQASKFMPRFYVRGSRLEMDDFCKLLSNSVFTLCPRGYGKTSFRIQEALQYGSIPVYISDDHILPHNHIIPFRDYGLVVQPMQIKELMNDLVLLSQDEEYIKRKREAGVRAYQYLYSYESNLKLIQQDLMNNNHEKSTS